MNTKKKITIVFLLMSTTIIQAQTDTSKNTQEDPSQKMNMDAIYNRPFLTNNKSKVAIGGYLEAQYEYMGEDGITEGHQFSIPRLTVFIGSKISSSLQFMTEIEIEEGGHEIALEFAALDYMHSPMLNFRGGVIMNPIGAFNQNHDGPKWEFVDRPIAMTQMLPATWSTVGGGVYGKFLIDDFTLGYEAYITSGFDESIIDNESSRTSLAAAKNNPVRFTEGNGHPLYTAKLAVQYKNKMEVGLSYMGGIYNSPELEGLIVQETNYLHTTAVDWRIGNDRFKTIGEFAYLFLDLPTSYHFSYASQQSGGYTDLIARLFTGKVGRFYHSAAYAVLRLEYVDWNQDKFSDGSAISDQIFAIVPGISLRPSSQTVFRLNYRYMKQTDVFGNPPASVGGVQVGIATYF